MQAVSVRYIVDDIEVASKFYTTHLGFFVKFHQAPGFAILTRGNLDLLLNQPGVGGAGQSTPDGRIPEPGGWNRIQIEVHDIAREVTNLREAGPRFRNAIVTGQGGKQVLLEDPSGNPVELFEPGSQEGESDNEKAPAFRATAIRYQVKDVDCSIAFYTKHLGFNLERKSGTAFASISNGQVVLWLSGPESSGSRPMPDGRKQEPGGWNRLALEVKDLPSHLAVLRMAGLRFRNEIEVGPGGKQIQLEDPDGNPVEFFEPAST